jgi:hypothetical protein
MWVRVCTGPSRGRGQRADSCGLLLDVASLSIAFFSAILLNSWWALPALPVSPTVLAFSSLRLVPADLWGHYEVWLISRLDLPLRGPARPEATRRAAPEGGNGLYSALWVRKNRGK